MVTKAQLTEKILIKLGKGAIRPNVTTDQVENSIDEAVQFFYDRVDDGTDLKYFKYLVTQDDVDRGDNSITLPNEVVEVNKLLPVRRRSAFMLDESGSSYNVGNTAYNHLSNARHTSLSDYYIAKQYIEMFKSMFSASDGFSFSKFSNKVQLDLEIGRDVHADDYIVFYVRTLIDPNDFNRFYNDRLLLNLATAYARKYEAVNLTKLTNIDIPGGVKFDVGRLEDRADKEITKYEADIENYYRPPLGIYVS